MQKIIDAACEKTWRIAAEAESHRLMLLGMGKEPTRSVRLKELNAEYSGALRVLASVLLAAGEDVGVPGMTPELLPSGQLAEAWLEDWAMNRGDAP